jgi:hypothetical protein
MVLSGFQQLFCFKAIFRVRHVNAQRRSQIDFVLLLLHDNDAQSLASHQFAHRLCLTDALTLTPHRCPFVLQIRAQHFDWVI